MATSWSLNYLKTMELLEELREEAMSLHDGQSSLMRNLRSAQGCSIVPDRLPTLMATSTPMTQL